MAFLDPLLILVFFAGLALTFFVARFVRRALDRRRAGRIVPGPDHRSRQVRRAEKRRSGKRDRW